MCRISLTHPIPLTMNVHENILGAIGNTPMIRMNKVAG